jgi:hypothetical protein
MENNLLTLCAEFLCTNNPISQEKDLRPELKLLRALQESCGSDAAYKNLPSSGRAWYSTLHLMLPVLRGRYFEVHGGVLKTIHNYTHMLKRWTGENTHIICTVVITKAEILF